MVNKCSNCGTTDIKTFWTFEDDTMLCDKCHKLYGKDWQKKIDAKHGKKEGHAWKNFFAGIGFIFIILVVLSYFGFLTPSENITPNSANTQATANNNSNNAPATQVLPRAYCGDGECNNGESCNSCPTDCQQFCNTPSQETLTVSTNEEPYYSTFCDKINPYDLSVREAATKAIRNDPGSYSVTQLFDIYDWVKSNIIYQNVPLIGIPYPAKETLTTKSGDCKNQAVLIASMIEAIGGTAKVVVDPSCEHAYAIVRFGSAEDDFSWFPGSVAEHYGKDVEIQYITNKDGIWIIFDPAGEEYPGNTLSECSGDRTIYYVDSCLSCINQYPTKPYTYGDECYSECPPGTVHNNNYACSPCPLDSWSYKNKCVTCDEGYSLHTDGRCYPE